MDSIINAILSFRGTFFTLIGILAIYYAAKTLIDRQAKGKTDWGIIRSIVLFSIAMIGVISLILSLPMSSELKGQVTSLMGIVISAVLALSSATFIGNGLAGIMLRTINSFKPGDFIEIDDHFGRITERGLFHTEIQTQTRDLTTVPNLYLTTTPFRIKRSTGTLISGVCSLGYDVNRVLIEKTLIKAAEMAGLENAFVRVVELGDFSVVYKVFGLTKEIKTILSAQSRLNGAMLDALHEADIEIVSPNFMNQRPVGETVLIPTKMRPLQEATTEEAPEDLIFDKAEEAENIENQKAELKEIDDKIALLNEEKGKATEEAEKANLDLKIKELDTEKESLLEKIDEHQKEMEKAK